MAFGMHPVRHLRRYRQIVGTFVRHGFGYAMRRRLRRPLRESAPLREEELAHQFRLALQELGPTFVKLGQVLSTRPDVLSPPYIAELELLQDEVPPESWEDIRQVLLREYAHPPEELFAFIDPQPLAAASLAQVHAAILKDGSEVVLKVQRPNIRRVIDTDLAILRELASGAQYTPLGRIYDMPAIVDQFAATLRAELDYQREGRNADRFRANFKDEPFLYIPKIHWEYSTRHVLALERIYGIKINDLPMLKAAGMDLHAIVEHSAHIIIKEVLEDGFFHADPHPGNFFVMPGEVLGGMDFGMVGYVDDRMRTELIRLYTASIEMDTEGVVDQFVRMGIADEDVQRRELGQDLAVLLHKYRGVPLKEIRAGEVIGDLTPLAFRYRLRFPTDLWLLGKTLQMMEGVALTLYPGFDIFAVSQPIVRRLIWRVILPDERLPRAVIRAVTEWGDVATLFPRAASRVMQQAERGELFTVHWKEAEDSLQVLDRLVTRLSLSVMIAALTVALAFLIPATTGNVLARAMTVVGFLFSTTLLIWLGFSILRSYRRPHRH